MSVGVVAAVPNAEPAKLRAGPDGIIRLPQGGYLKPWQKGKSGNPGGWSRKARELRAEIEATYIPGKALEVLERMRQVALGCSLQVTNDDGEQVTAWVIEKTQVMAAKLFLERVMGPPTNMPPPLNAPSPEEIRAGLLKVVMSDPELLAQLRGMLNQAVDERK